VTQNELHLLGTKKDNDIRTKKLRKDNKERRDLVVKARALLEYGHPIVGTSIEELLKPQSLHPNMVCCITPTHHMELKLCSERVLPPRLHWI
jgi:hypothetical protein